MPVAFAGGMAACGACGDGVVGPGRQQQERLRRTPVFLCLFCPSRTNTCLLFSVCLSVFFYCSLFFYQVYKVWNAAHRRMEALSVMDLEEIVGEEEVVS